MPFLFFLKFESPIGLKNRHKKRKIVDLGIFFQKVEICFTFQQALSVFFFEKYFIFYVNGFFFSKEWQKLGDLSREEAMLEFVRLLDVVCPTFKPHINERAAIETSKAVL